MEQRNITNILAGLIYGVAFVFVVIGSYAKSFGDTANSRLATVYALTGHGTFYIDPVDGKPNPFERRTIDKVQVNGRALSSKPPMLPLLMTAEYLVIHRLTGWSLDSWDDTNEILRYMSMTFAGLGYLVILICVSKILGFYVTDPRTRLVLLAAAAFGTQLWGYSTNLNNHVPGACAMMVSLYFALGMASGKLEPKVWRFALFGLAAGLTPTLDTPAAIFPFAAGLYLLARFPKPTLVFGGIAAALPLAVHAGVMVVTTGSPLPVQMHKAFYLGETSYWRHPMGVDCLNEPKSTYLFNMTLGKSGLFSLYPITLIGLAAALRALVRKDSPNRVLILAGFLCFALLTAYYCLKTDNYGGEAYGFRWYIPAMPVLLLMGGHVLAGMRARWKWIFIGLMLGISFYSAWQCSVTPWAANQEWTTRFLGPTY